MLCNFPVRVKTKRVVYSKVRNLLINVFIEHFLGALSVACYKTNAYASM